LTAGFNFTGTAIYVFGINLNATSPSPAVKNQNLDFLVDGIFVSNYQFTPTEPNDNYNVNFFAISGLSPTFHTLTMSARKNSYVQLDYLIYTATSDIASDTAPTTNSGDGGVTPTTTVTATPSLDNDSSPSGVPVGTIVGVAVCSFGGITLIVFLIFLFRYFRRNNRPSPGKDGIPEKSKKPDILPGPNAVEPFITLSQPSLMERGEQPSNSESTETLPQTSVDPPSSSSKSRLRPSNNVPSPQMTVNLTASGDRIRQPKRIGTSSVRSQMTDYDPPPAY